MICPTAHALLPIRTERVKEKWIIVKIKRIASLVSLVIYRLYSRIRKYFAIRFFPFKIQEKLFKMQRFVYVIGVRGSRLTQTIDVYKFAAEVLSQSLQTRCVRWTNFLFYCFFCTNENRSWKYRFQKLIWIRERSESCRPCQRHDWIQRLLCLAISYS